MLILAGLLLMGCLAFFLQDVVRQVIIIPVAYLWWVLRIVYATIPQVLLWLILLVILTFSIIASLLKRYSSGRKYELLSKPAMGAVESLAGWISNSSRQGNYYRWLVANRLGKLALAMAIRIENRQPPARLEQPKTLETGTPAGIQRYLKAGLEESFVDYPLPRLPFLRRQATPFDQEIDEVVQFLETQMEAGSGQKNP
jgi:hypothetical protein